MRQSLSQVTHPTAPLAHGQHATAPCLTCNRGRFPLGRVYLVTWVTVPLEERMKAALIHKHQQARGDYYFGLYTTAREKILFELAEEIKRTEPNLTDHGPRHIANVMEMASELIGEQAFVHEDGYLTAADAYTLCMAILFHDVGNIFTRREHEKRIGEVWGWVRKGQDPPRMERTLIVRIAGAHTGTTLRGSRDTLAELELSSNLDGVQVHEQELAAILRFADELAEGPQRTSSFVRDILGYPPESEIHHRYADITSVHVDRGNSRVALTYNFDLRSSGIDPEELINGTEELLRYTYTRVMKLDEERQYTRFHSNILVPFKETRVQINFWIDDRKTLVDLQPLTLSDKRVPGSPQAPIHNHDPAYAVETVCAKLKEALREAAADA